MDRRTVMALLLIAVIFILLPYYWKMIGFAPEQQDSEVVTDSTATMGEESLDTAVVDETAGPSGSPEPAASTPPDLGAQVYTLDTIPEEVTSVSTDLYEARISSQGGTISGFHLSRFKYFHGDEIDLVPGRDDYPLSVEFPEASHLSSHLIHFNADAKEIDLRGREDDSASLTMAGVTPGGAPIRITYTFRGSTYFIGMKVELGRSGELTSVTRLDLAWRGGLEPTEENRSDDYGYFSAYVRQGGEVANFKDFDDGVLQESSSGSVDWVATKSKYFLVALIRTDDLAEDFRVRATEKKVIERGQEVAKRVFDLVLGNRLASDTAPEFELYLGPVDYHRLSRVGRDLDRTVEMGFWLFRPFAIVILWFVTTLHKVIPNYGLVIIIFTVVMKVIFYPFSRKNYMQMARMKSMQPKLKELQEKYKEDPQELNRRMMKLYREEKFNPFGGCIWMLPQLPIFWALFTVFRSVIDLRGASFLWLEDLSQSSMLLAVIMAGAMLIQQLLTNKDPKQKFMVYGFPVLMFFLFKGFPAGLVLYWTVYNLLSIVEQKSVERTLALNSAIPEAVVVEDAPPAKPSGPRRKPRRK